MTVSGTTLDKIPSVRFTDDVAKIEGASHTYELDDRKDYHGNYLLARIAAKRNPAMKEREDVR